MIKEQKKTDPKFTVILSIFVAITIWGYVVTVINPQIDQKFSNIPVEITNIDSLTERDLVLASDDEYYVDVVVHGRKKELFQLKNKIKASIDIGSITEKGTYDLEVKIDGIPGEIDLLSKIPETISLEIDQIITINKDINVTITGTPKDNMATIAYSIDTKSVSLKGPEKILNTVEKVNGEINVEDATGDIRQMIKVYPMDKNNKEVTGITIEPQEVEAEVTIGETKNVDINVPLAGEVKDGYIVSQIIVLPAQLTLGGSPDLINKIDKIDTEEININNIDKNIEKEVEIVLPEGIHIMGAIPKIIVMVNIEEVYTGEIDVPLDSIELRNQLENTTVDITKGSPSYKVLLSGLKEDVVSVGIDNIKLFADIEGLGVGSHTIFVEMESLDPGIDYTIEPKEMIINISNK